MGAPEGKELVPKWPSLPLKRGSWMHKLQEAYFMTTGGVTMIVPVQRGRKVREVEISSWEEMQALLTAEFDRLFDEQKQEYGDLPAETERMFLGYLRKWKDDNERFALAHIDGQPAIEFMVEMDLSRWGVKAPFKGRIDLLMEDLEYGGLWIRDAKWMKVIPGPDERMMSPQNIMYSRAGRTMGIDIRGFIYDYGRTKPPTLPRILKAGTVSLAKCDTDVFTYLHAIKKAHGKQWKKFIPIYRHKLEELKERESTWFVRERIPTDGPRMLQGFREFIYAAREIQDRGRPFRTFIRSCRWDCDYLQPCVAQFQGLDISRLMNTQYTIEEERYGIDEETGPGSAN